ncbi:MAG: hypothetical protein AB7V14_12030 [Kiritimatiellia bacterium]
MKPGWKQVVGRILPLALALGLAGAACVHSGNRRAKAAAGRPAAEPMASGGVPAKIAPSRPSVQKDKGRRIPKGTKKDSGNKKIKGQKAESEKTLKLDPSDVLALQMRAIREQQQDENAFIQRRNRATCWMDDAHAKAYCWMDNAVRKVDVKWLAEDDPYNPELSTFKLRTLARVGGRGNEQDSEILVRFRADVALPGLEKKLHLYVDNAGRDSLPGADPMKQESDTRLGVRTVVRMIKNTELNLGGGLRWRDSNPVVYTALEWPWTREMGPFEFRLNPRGVYYSDEGFGQKITLTWTRPIGQKKIFQIRTAERSSEGLDGVEFEQSLRFAWLRSGRGRGWVAQASMFPHLQSSEWFMDDYLVNVTWRDALYRKWIYYTLTPQVQFPREDDYEPQPSLRIGLEILFGGKIGDLL